MNVRPTYTLEQIEEARSLWDDFPSEWDQWCEIAMKGPGIIFPPTGSIHDSWDEQNPSQRAILIRAMRETPNLLIWAIRGCRSPSWARVIERLLSGRDELRSQIEIDQDEHRPSLDPTPLEATQALKDILTTIHDPTKWIP